MSVQGTEKRRIQQVIDKAGNTKLVHPETSADMVIFDDTTAQTGVTNVQQAIEKVADLAKTGGVTGVKGNNETAYRKGNVNLTPENIGAEPTITTKGTAFNKDFGSAAGTVMEGNDTRVTTAVIDIAGLKTSVATAQSTADTAKAIAEGRAKAVSFNTVSDMVTALKSASNTDYKIGDNLFIKATSVPDYWISGVLATNAGTYGYYEISELETQKVDLSGYQTKTDNGLSTTAKTVVGAINEVKGVADGAASTASTANTQASNNKTAIDNIVNGSTKVKNAENADEATHAGSADSATTATKLSASKTISLTGDVTGSAATDFSTNPSIATTLKDSGVTAGSYSAVVVNTKGIVTAGGKSIEFGTSGQTTPSKDLMVGGIFFELVQ